MSLDRTTIDATLASTPATFSGVAVVVERGETVGVHTVGYANRSEGLPNSLDTRFGTASGTKTFTAVAIGQLAARGLLDVERPLATYAGVPLPTLDPHITIHQLLTHTSGVPDYFDEDVMDDYEALWREVPMYTLRRPADFLPLFVNRPMQFAPGARFHYNNAGFVLLGLVVEHVTGMALTEYVQQYVFAPAGMHDSGYFAANQLPARTAIGYIDEPTGSGWRTNVFAIPIIGGGDGGAYVTAPDMIAFWRALLNHTLLPAQQTQAMLTAHTPADDQMSYGYGIWMTPVAGGAMKYTLMGGDPGVSFYSTCYPERDIQIVAIGNVSQGAGRLSRALEQIVEASG